MIIITKLVKTYNNFFFFNDTATTEIYTLSLHDALPIYPSHFVLQQLDYLEYIDLYHDRIRMFHVKDAEFNPTGRQGVYGGFPAWIDRAGRVRSLRDGQANFKAIFSKLPQYDHPRWAVLDWERRIQHPAGGGGRVEAARRHRSREHRPPER